ncbi:MAG: hypothetical protein ACRC7J_14775, partial [Vibrio ordalii]|uniref:hypothetical protein n=1 Tax=Vibrio ordalii TaxID=28174 RepID=UPI003F2B6E4A
PYSLRDKKNKAGQFALNLAMIFLCICVTCCFNRWNKDPASIALIRRDLALLKSRLNWRLGLDSLF